MQEDMDSHNSYKYDFLQMLNKELLQEPDSTVVQQIAMLFIARPSCMVSRYCMPGVCQLLVSRKLQLVGYEVLRALGSATLYDQGLLLRSNELARSLCDCYEKASQKVQIGILQYLTSDIEENCAQGDEPRPRCNDFIRKIHKNATSNRFSDTAAFRCFCQACERHFDMEPSSRAGSKLRASSGRPAGRSPGASVAPQSPGTSSCARNLRSMSNAQASRPEGRSTSGSALYKSPAARRSSSSGRGRPINKYLDRQRECQFTVARDVGYIRQ